MELKTVLSIGKKETKWILATTNETCTYNYFFPNNGWKSRAEAVVSCLGWSRSCTSLCQGLHKLSPKMLCANTPGFLPVRETNTPNFTSCSLKTYEGAQEVGTDPAAMSPALYKAQFKISLSARC